MKRAMIHKVELPLKNGNNVFEFVMGDDAKIIHIAEQTPDVVTVWYRFDPERVPRSRRRFTLIGTGWEHFADLTHSGTVLMKNGLVLHLMEEPR